MQMEKSLFRILDLAEVNATYGLTAQNEIGFFLCRRGQADILVNDRVYPVNGCFLCFHVPYTLHGLCATAMTSTAFCC